MKNSAANLFGWDYRTSQILNEGGSPSRFSTVYGQGGIVSHVKKDSYQLITTSDVSDLGNEMIGGGYPTTAFTHRNGEVLGLNVSVGTRPSKVGDIQYGAILTFPNNNGGSGKYDLFTKRLICGNGATRTTSLMSGNKVTVFHDMTKDARLDIMLKAVKGFFDMITKSESLDVELDKVKLDRHEVMRRLNQWFYTQELPATQKKELSESEFRKLLATDPESVPSYERYTELMDSFSREAEYNKKLKLDLTAYTVYATAANYLSRRREKSKSSAAEETMIQRTSEKLFCLEDLELVTLS